MFRASCAAIAIALTCGVLAGCADLEAMHAYRAGTDALDRGDPQRAIADLEHAAVLAPEVSAIQNHLGIAYEEAGRPDDAQRAYEKAVALDCDNRAAENNLRQFHESRSPADAGEPNTGQGASRSGQGAAR